MARFGVLVAAAAGALLATVSAGTTNATPDQCNPVVCMDLAIAQSDCVDDMGPRRIAQNDMPIVTSATLCVCNDSELKQFYFDCSGFCKIDPANEPFCGAPVKKDVVHDDEDVNTAEVVDADVIKPNYPEITAPAELHERDDIAEREPTKVSGRLRNWFGFCGVPGVACGGKAVATQAVAVERPQAADDKRPEITAPAELHERDELAEREPTKISGTLRNWIGFCGVPGVACGEKMAATEAAEAEVPKITAAPELEHANIAERAPTKVSGTLRNWIGFCGVPGVACGEKVAVPTAGPEPGSDFVDIGDVQSDKLNGRTGSCDERAIALEGSVPTTLQTVKGSLRPSN